MPDSCCKLTQNEDRDVWWVDPQKCTPKDRKKCNEDAQGRRDGSDYVNGMVITYIRFNHGHVNYIIQILTDTEETLENIYFEI